MSLERALNKRSGSKCELCTGTNNLSVYEVPPASTGGEDKNILICIVAQNLS